MNISDGLKTARLRSGLKQFEFAKKAKISQTYVSQIESGKKEPSIDVLKRYEKITKQPLAVILWDAMTEESVQKTKLTEYRKIKPIIDDLINSMFSGPLTKPTKGGKK